MFEYAAGRTLTLVKGRRLLVDTSAVGRPIAVRRHFMNSNSNFI
jgi:hypothetical protein